MRFILRYSARMAMCTQLVVLMILLLAPVLASETMPEKSEVFPPGMNGIARYRIPGIVVTPKGTVLAYAEAGIVCARFPLEWLSSR